MSRFVQRSLGLVSTLVLARILVPDDFAIVAISAIFLHLFLVFSNTGSEHYICQKSDVSLSDLNTAWTLDLIMRLGLFVLFFFSSPFIADFYDNPVLTDVLRVSSIVLILQGLISPGILLLKRQLKYKKIFLLEVVNKVASFCVVMIIVYFDPSYWAIIFGDVAAALIGLIGSYVITQHRPVFSFKNIKSQWNFSKWVLGKGFIGYTRANIDTMLISKMFPVTELGQYHVIKGITTLPATDIINPAVQPLLAAFSQFKNKKDELSKKFSLSLFIVLMMISPIASFMYLYPSHVIQVLLGDQWVSASVILSNLSLMLFAMTIGNIVMNCCIALGKVKALFWYDVISLIAVSSFLISFSGYSIGLFALARSCLEVVIVIALTAYLSTIIKIDIKILGIMFISILIPVGIASHFSSTVVPNFNYNALFDLVALTLVFFTIYFACFLLILFIFRKSNYEFNALFQLLLRAISHAHSKFK